MARQYVVSPFQKFWDASGLVPLSGGSVSFCENGTTTLAPIYRDTLLTLPQQNPYPLDAGGRIRGDVRFSGTLTLIPQDSNGNALDPIDDVQCLPLIKVFAPYNQTSVYGEGGPNIVTGSDDNYYVSTASNNLNIDPTDSAGYWEQVSFLPSADDDAAARLAQIGAIPADQDAMLIGSATPEWSGASQGSLVRGYISGLITSPGTDANNDIDVSAGMCVDSTNSVVITLPSVFTKQLDATWAAGSNMGGRASGVSLANTWYHLFAVIVGGEVDAMFDTSPVCANGVANNAVTAFRRIGSILRSSNIVPYFQSGNYFYWDAKASDVLAAGTTDSAVTLTVSAPLGVQVRYVAYVIMTTNHNGAIYFLATNPSQTDTTPGSAAYLQLCPANSSGQFRAYSTRLEVMTNTSSQIRYRFTGIAAATTSASFAIRPFGWYEVDHVRSA